MNNFCWYVFFDFRFVMAERYSCSWNISQQLGTKWPPCFARVGLACQRFYSCSFSPLPSRLRSNDNLLPHLAVPTWIIAWPRSGMGPLFTADVTVAGTVEWALMEGKEERAVIRPESSSKSSSSMPERHHNDAKSSLPLFSKLMLYGMSGFFIEVMFTATWYFVDSATYSHGWKLHGCSSVWSFPIYGLSCLVVEKMFLSMDGKVPLLLRGVVYLVWTYVWEFSTGLLLRQFNACPWDYEGYTYFNIMGLVTFDYAPLWYTGGLLLEMSIIRSALDLQYRAKSHVKGDWR